MGGEGGGGEEGEGRGRGMAGEALLSSSIKKEEVQTECASAIPLFKVETSFIYPPYKIYQTISVKYSNQMYFKNYTESRTNLYLRMRQY